jgi:hypothetical protein
MLIALSPARANTGIAFDQKRWLGFLWNLGESHPVILVLARSPLAIESDLIGVVVTPKELCLSSVLESHPMKRNSRVSQHLLQGCMS